jgi:hypothetical protein
MKNTFLHLYKPMLLGITVLFVSIIAAFFLRQDGVKINTDAWPPSAKSILIEQPNEPLTKDQWKRINQALKSNGNDGRGSHLFAAEIRSAWFIYLPLPLIALFVVRYMRLKRPIAASILAITPNLLLLIWAFLRTHAFYP